MKTDGPTINEMSSIDTTGSLGADNTPRIAETRPVSRSTQIKNWWGESWRQIVIGLVIAGVSFFLGNLILNHENRLTVHDKDIEYIQKVDAKQDGEIEQLKDKTQEITTDVRLIEQRVELTSGDKDNSKHKNKK